MHVNDILRNLYIWGTKSVCFAGGGEPTLHEDFARIVEKAYHYNLEVGISTNGTRLTLENVKAIAEYARFCGLSIDAGSADTWSKTKGAPKILWETLISGALELNEYAAHTNVDTTYKFMLTPFNQSEILKAARLAKELRFKSFFVRPAACENVPGLNADYKFNVKRIQKQIAELPSLETENFHVYGSFNRVDDKLKRRIAFDRCLITPIMAIFCADGYCYLCIDYREREYGRLCKHEEIRSFWNSPKHHEIINAIKLERCPRCAMGNYNEQIAAYERDDMYRWFA